MVIHDARDLGRAVADWREAQRLTQQALAELLGVSRTAIAHFEQGRRLPNPDVLRRVRSRCGFSPFVWGPFDRAGPVVVECHCLTYFLRWVQAEREQKSRHRYRLVLNVKNGETYVDTRGQRHPNAANFAARKMRREWGADFLRGRVFVPVPRSLQTAEHGLKDWSAHRLASELASLNSGTVEVLIERSMGIRKSSDPKKPFPRPSVGEHRATMSYVGGGPVPQRVTLVDDLVTKGSTIAAAASNLAARGYAGPLEVLTVGYTVPHGRHTPEDNHELTLTWNGKSSSPSQS